MRNQTVFSSSSAINSALILLVLAACVAQLFIDFNTDNIASACLVTASSLATLLYLRWTTALTSHPLSAFSLLGLCTTTQLGALLGQSGAWTPITYALRQPVATFATLAMFQAIALSAHALYRFLPALQFGESSLLRGGLRRAGLYLIPSVGMVWIFGVIGFLAHLTGGAEVGGKLIAGFRFLIFAPFLIPLYVQEEGTGYCKAKTQYLFLAAYLSMVVLLGVAANARGLMLTGVVTMGLVMTLWLMCTPIVVRPAQLVKLGVVGAMLFALVGPLSDLSTAMVVARQSSGVGTAKASPVQMVKKTLDVLQRPELIAAYRLRTKLASQHKAYDETYLANPMMARFVETKFHDNAFFFTSSLTDSAEQELQRITIDMVLALIPNPVLKAVGVAVNKEQINYSIGDYMVYLSRGLELGGRKTGSVFAHGLALFGVLFPVVYFFMVLLLFALLDLLTFKTATGKVFLALPAMVQLFRYFQYGISGESLPYMVSTATRGLLQTLFVYFCVFYLAKLLLAMYPTRLAPRPA
ncbi:hypothetical protein [Janthinobacterium sp.]|uniref:hypothetical protein n=1 Tax=Janthinobacterium sp. TaxID=1871054 RepID=UPI00293D907B|nr:hypothetical protein [Janthinobacterium sp.]